VAELREALELLIDERVRARARRRRVGVLMVSALTFAAFLAVGARLSSAVPVELSRGVELGKTLVDQALALRSATEHRPANALAPKPVSAVEKPTSTGPTAAPDAEALPPPAVAHVADPSFGEASEAAAESGVAVPVTVAAVQDTASEVDRGVTPAPKASPAAPALSQYAELRARGRSLKALHTIRQAAKAFPREPEVLKVHATAAFESKAYGEARRAAEQWNRVDSSPEARLTLARLERATGNLGRAIALARSVLEGGPSAEAERLLAGWTNDQRVASR
jgi:hypothetical protein